MKGFFVLHLLLSLSSTAQGYLIVPKSLKSWIVKAATLNEDAFSRSNFIIKSDMQIQLLKLYDIICLTWKQLAGQVLYQMNYRLGQQK
jgi:hypothetical protein